MDRPVRSVHWPVMKAGPAGGAGLLRVVVGEGHAFVEDAVDVGRAVAHHAAGVVADVRLADIVAEDDDDVRPPRGAGRRLGPALAGRGCGLAPAACRPVAARGQPPRRRRAACRGVNRPSAHGRVMSPVMLVGLVAEHAAEADMAHAGVHHLRVARSRPVAPAVARRAEEGAALHHLAGDADGGLARDRSYLPSPGRAGSAGAQQGLRGIGRVPGGEPIGGPLPDIAGHLVQPVAIGREGAHRAGALEPVAGEVAPGEGALPGIGQVHAAGVSSSPQANSGLQPAARRELPLRLGRQRLAGPGA